MEGFRGQHRQAVRHAHLPWSDKVVDPRDARGTRHEHLGLLALVVAALAVGKRGLRDAAHLSKDVGARTRKRLGLPQAVAGTTLWRLLGRQGTTGLRETVCAQAHRLLEDPRSARVDLPMGVVSIDGKSLWTTRQGDVPGLESVANDAEGSSLWRLGALRAVFTSLVAAPCVDLEFIGAKEGESPAFRQMLPRVVEAFGKHFGVVTGDAGLAASENAELVRSHRMHYLFGLKGNQPTLQEHAVDVLARNRGSTRACTVEKQHGEVVRRELWTHSLKPGEVDFPGARFLLLVLQSRKAEDGSVKEECRYFVTSLDTTCFNFQQLLQLVRLHWAIENRHNWTLDVILGEDEHQPCRPSRTALEAVAWLRALAYNILSSWRAMLPPDGRHLVAWRRACELLRDGLVHGRKEASHLAAA